jgi:hypothetical protein
MTDNPAPGGQTKASVDFLQYDVVVQGRSPHLC